MVGGVGSRFWPMSTPDYPKQFIDMMGVGRSLIQLTVDRLKPICPVENMWVVTNEKYIRIVKEQIPDMPVDNILAEPEACNTAPCIAYACWKIQMNHLIKSALYKSGNGILPPSLNSIRKMRIDKESDQGSLNQNDKTK